MRRWLALTAMVTALGAWAGAPEKLSGRYHALTLNPDERRELRAPGLERVTASSGACLEEGMALDAVETMYVQASCAGVRTSIAWLASGQRIHVLVCAEDESRSTASLKKRQSAQRELKNLRGVTACVRGEEIHLLGWVRSTAEKERLAALAKKLTLVDKVEVLSEEERD